MRELDLIRGRFNQTFKLEYEFGNSSTHRAWHGPSLMRSLAGLDVEQAKVRRMGETFHLEIVNHCIYWMEEVDRALHGEDIFDVEAIEDWAEAGGSLEEWEADLEKLVDTFEKVDRRIYGLKAEDLEKRLDATFGETYFDFTFRKMLYGISDHNVYHAGQISILK